MSEAEKRKERELEAEWRKLQQERAMFEVEKQHIRAMYDLPPDQRPVELLSQQEIRDQIDRNTLREQRINRERWIAAIQLDQYRKWGREYTI
jgi:hypothetical protein